MNLTLDSSVIVASLRKQEKRHKECKTLLEQLKNGEHTAYESGIVLVEVAAAIRRRTGSKDLAIRVKNDLLELNFLNFLELTELRMKRAAEIASRIGVRGMDAIVIQIAEETRSVLVTLDEEMMKAAKEIVTVKEIQRLLT